MENHLGLGNGKSIRKINLSLLKSRVSKMIPVKNNKSWKIHSIQIKILMISVLIALGTTIVSLVISYYTEINTIKKTTELYMTQYISFADENFNSMLTEARKISLAVATEQEIILPTMKEPFVEAS